MNKICLIGNSGYLNNVSDGQTEKVRLYAEKIIEEGNELFFVDLENFIKHPFRILDKIKYGIKYCNRLVLLSAERGSRVLIPFINWHNRKRKKPFIFPLIGSSVLHYTIDKLNPTKRLDFLTNDNYSHSTPNKRLVKNLKKITTILPETEELSNTFRKFYRINNVVTLNNFRKRTPLDNIKHQDSKILNLVYVSRVMRSKGIFDLMNCVNDINNQNGSPLIKLSIYGIKDFTKADNKLFESLLSNSVMYHGQIDNKFVEDVIYNSDLFVFPTKCMGEGTPGVIAESLLAGTPILTSTFPQVKVLLRNGFDSIFFEINNSDDLKKKILWAANHKKELLEMRKNALQSGEKFSYEYNKEIFLKYICGVE